MSQQSASASSYSSAFPSPPPPVDLGTYSRSMHQHTKRQMESINQSLRQGSGTPTNGHQQSSSSATSSVPNGVSNQRRNPGDSFSY